MKFYGTYIATLLNKIHKSIPRENPLVIRQVNFEQIPETLFTKR